MGTVHEAEELARNASGSRFLSVLHDLNQCLVHNAANREQYQHLQINNVLFRARRVRFARIGARSRGHCNQSTI